MKTRHMVLKGISTVMCCLMLLSTTGPLEVEAASKTSTEKTQTTQTTKTASKKTKKKNKTSAKTTAKNSATTKTTAKSSATTKTAAKSAKTKAEKKAQKKARRLAKKQAKAEKKAQEAAAKKPENSHYTVHIGSGTKRLADEYQDYTYAMCKKYGIENYYQVILTQMCVESGYDYTAMSPGNNYGLMQISVPLFPHLQSKLGLTDLHDPHQNIEAGVYIMAEFIHRYGDVQAALVCYHRGESAARKGMRSDSYSARIVSMVSGLDEV